MSAGEIDSALLRWLRMACTQVSADSLQKVSLHTKPAACVPPQVWVVWKQVPFGVGKTIELVTADENRAIRLAASSTMLRVEALDVEDTGQEG